MSLLMLDDKYAKMPWDEIDTVVFDVGGVLVSFNPPAFLNDLFPGDEALQKVLKARIFGSPYWHMMDHGLMTVEEAAQAMIGLREDLREPIEKAMGCWIEKMLGSPIQESVDFLYECKRRGKKLYVLSNFSEPAFSRTAERHPCFQEFDGMVVSCRIGKLKPNPDIYQHLIDQFGCDPARTLFIDDNFSNIEACLYAGWQAICYNQPGKLSAFWQE